MSEQKVKKSDTAALIELRSFKRGESVHATGDHGQAWRVVSGAVRLDASGPDGPMFASLALPGDVIGAEALVGGHYTFGARALTPCVLTPWKVPRTSLLGLFASTQRRAAEVLALRGGRAADRVARLLRLLGGGGETAQAGSQGVMPRLRDVADITDLTIETVSRVATVPSQAGGLPGRPRRAHSLHRAPALAPIVTA
jgi:CRP-like cAMP-binding protein